MLTASLSVRLLRHLKDSPDAIAIRDSYRNWTWRDLLQRAAAYREMVDTWLGSDDGRRNTLTAVPVLVDRSGETVAAILGIVLGGRAFSPLAPDQPPERLRACLTALGANDTLLVVDPAMHGQVADTIAAHPLLLVDKKVSLPMLCKDSSGDCLLYVLFTSGSTGVPKGVMVSHGNINNTMLWSADTLKWNADDVLGNVAPFFFDISMFDLFTLCYFGVPLSIISNPSDPHSTLAEINEHRVSSIFSAPVFFSQFLRANLLKDKRLQPLRRIIAGGDFFPPAHIVAWLEARSDLEIWNVWGPTETSIVNTMHRLVPEDRPALLAGRYPPVGRVHPRMQFVLLREDGSVSPPGEPGEICMIGPSVSLGYLSDVSEARDAYFEWNGERAFHTRDIGSVDEDGNLYMLGRLGSMVKIAGYRVDLGEVESAAVQVPGILLAAAFVHQVEPGVQEIYLALEGSDEKAPGVFAVKQQLRQLLPGYMVPKRIFLIEAMPRTSSGKVDRRRVAARFVHSET